MKTLSFLMGLLIIAACGVTKVSPYKAGWTDNLRAGEKTNCQNIYTNPNNVQVCECWIENSAKAYTYPDFKSGKFDDALDVIFKTTCGGN